VFSRNGGIVNFLGKKTIMEAVAAIIPLVRLLLHSALAISFFGICALLYMIFYECFLGKNEKASAVATMFAGALIFYLVHRVRFTYFKKRLSRKVPPVSSFGNLPTGQFD
jgi:hypothetical protein